MALPTETIGASYAEEVRRRKVGLRVVIEPIPGLSDEGIITRAGYYFQCPPLEELSYEVQHSHTDYDTVSAGQFSRRGGPQLRTVGFDTLFVDQGSYTILDEDPVIEEAIDTLQAICASGSPFLLTCAHELPPGGYLTWSETQAGPELQMAATLRTVRVTEKAGEPDARYATVTFVEYRAPIVGRQRLGKRPGRRKFPRKVKLQSDGRAFDEDRREIGSPPLAPLTLRVLARHFYRDPSMWRQIARANGVTDWGGDHALILHSKYRRDGGTITVPKK